MLQALLALAVLVLPQAGGLPDGAPDGVALEWDTRATALRSLGSSIPLFAGIEAPDWEVDGSGVDLARVDARARVARLWRPQLLALPEDGLWSLPPLESALALAAFEFTDAEHAERVLSAALRSEFSTVRAAAVERASRALFEFPELRARPLPAPGDGKDRDATERLARARLASGLFGGQVQPWLQLEAATGRAWDAALIARFERLVRAPLDAAALDVLVAEARRAQVPPGIAGTVEHVRIAAWARGDAAAPVSHRPGSLGGVDPELFAETEGAFVRALRGRRTAAGEAHVETLASAAIARALETTDVDGEQWPAALWVRLAARVQPPEWTLERCDAFSATELRLAALEGVEDRTEPIPPAALSPWVFGRAAGADRSAALELAANRFTFDGERALGALLERWLGQPDAFEASKREDTLDVFRALGRARMSPDTARALRGAFDRAPEPLRHDLFRALAPSPALTAFADVLAAELSQPVEVEPASNVVELSAALLANESVRAALVGAWERAADRVEAELLAEDGVDAQGVDVADGRATRLALALVDWAGDVDAEDKSRAASLVEAVLPRVAGLESDAARADVELSLGVESCERLAHPGAVQLGSEALRSQASLLAERFPDELRLRAAEVLLWRAPDPSALGEAFGLVQRKLENDIFLDPGRAEELLAAVARANPTAAWVIAGDLLLGSEPFLFPKAAELVARYGILDREVLFTAAEKAVADPLAGEVEIERARAAIRALAPALALDLSGDFATDAARSELSRRTLELLGRASRPSQPEPTEATQRAGATEDERYARTLLSSAAIATAARLEPFGSGGLGPRLEELLDRAFDVTRDRAASATRAALEGRDTSFAVRDPAITAFAALRPEAQRRLLGRHPDVWVLADATLLLTLADAAGAHDVALSLYVAADVAHAGARRGRGAALLEARALLGLLAAAEGILEADEGFSTISHASAEALALRALSTLLGRMRTGSLPSRVVARVLDDPDVKDGIDAELWIAGAAWVLRGPAEGLAAEVARAFARVDPQKRPGEGTGAGTAATPK